MESTQGRDQKFRGTQGLYILKKGTGKNPLFNAFLNATKEAGYPQTEDVNGHQQEGFGLFDRNIKKWKKMECIASLFSPGKKRKTSLSLLGH